MSEARSGTSSANSRTAGSLSVSSASRMQRSGSNSCLSTRARTSTGENDTSRALCLSARGSRNSRWRCSARSRRLKSGRNSTPPAALPRSSEGASSSICAPSTNGAPAGTSSRANSSARMPRSPRSMRGAATCASCARRFFASASAAERPSALSVSWGAGTDSGWRSARFTVASRRCRAIGFSRKSSAPMRVASTAVSMVACPDIMTTGMLSWPLAAHSLSSVMPSVSGIQISSSTRSGRPRSRTRRASAALSASATW